MSIKLTAKWQENLQKMGIGELTDILSYYPYRYEEIEELPFKDWQIGSKIIIEATVTDKPKINYYKGRQSVLYINVVNDDDYFRVSIFNRHWLMRLKVKEQITIIGTYEGNNKILASNINTLPLKQQLGIRPFYSMIDSKSEKGFNKLVQQVLEKYENQITDFIPENIKSRNDFLSKVEAIKQIHRPQNKKLLLKAINTLKYEEFLKFNLIMAKKKKR